MQNESDGLIMNIIEVKSFDFAVRIFKLKDYLVNEKKEYDVSRQILRSGTSMVQTLQKQSEGNLNPIFMPK